MHKKITKEIQDNETYTIATNAFTAKGGDGFDVFKKAYEEGRVTDLGLSDWENLAEQLKSLGKVNPKIEGRIVDVANSQVPDKNIPESEFSGIVDKPKVYEGNVTVDINNISLLENAVVKEI